ncbi:tetratricopeptide repeat protein [Dysgonomonas macrotermitis]|uniref:Tetratricopeptide repeat-containing protein n=1 Tax=Dysgonomonas macrotermitis TaxID=1346286 RepID=A0A1M4YQH2_9BACT|nr:tetratricopeptide repeat protein [Dysgonomonas macrotermitis]SHF08099.1 Tetratricopeptide repeat-containing protein [Dysgonomonas macrotermitis]
MRFLLISFFIFISCSLTAYSQPSSDKLIRKGVSLHDKGRYNDAISYYQQALKANPSSMSATYEMALSYLMLKDYDNALKYSTKVINANFKPLLVDAYCVKSTALSEMNKLDQSIKLLNEGLERCGDEYLIHYNLGLSYFKMKNLRLSIYHLQKAIEIDTTHPSAFLLYAYVLSDSERWVQSFMAFHFFLLLEPNTDRSKDAFGEMYDIITQKIPNGSPLLTPEDGIDRQKLYDQLRNIQPKIDDQRFQYAFFEQASRQIFFTLGQMQDDSRKGLLWDFFVPIYSEILESGYFDTYCRYTSVSYFPVSLEWWNSNTNKVDGFISWFEDGQGTTANDNDDFGDDSDM